MLPRGQRAQLSLWFERVEPAEQCPPEAGPCLSHAVPHVALSVLGAEISWMGLTSFHQRDWVGHGEEWGAGTLSPGASLCTEKGFRKSVWRIDMTSAQTFIFSFTSALK